MATLFKTINIKDITIMDSIFIFQNTKLQSLFLKNDKGLYFKYLKELDNDNFQHLQLSSINQELKKYNDFLIVEKENDIFLVFLTDKKLVILKNISNEKLIFGTFTDFEFDLYESNDCQLVSNDNHSKIDDLISSSYNSFSKIKFFNHSKVIKKYSNDKIEEQSEKIIQNIRNKDKNDFYDINYIDINEINYVNDINDISSDYQFEISKSTTNLKNKNLIEHQQQILGDFCKHDKVKIFSFNHNSKTDILIAIVHITFKIKISIFSITQKKVVDYYESEDNDNLCDLINLNLLKLIYCQNTQNYMLYCVLSNKLKTLRIYTSLSNKRLNLIEHSFEYDISYITEAECNFIYIILNKDIHFEKDNILVLFRYDILKESKICEIMHKSKKIFKMMKFIPSAKGKKENNNNDNYQINGTLMIVYDDHCNLYTAEDFILYKRKKFKSTSPDFRYDLIDIKNIKCFFQNLIICKLHDKIYVKDLIQRYSNYHILTLESKQENIFLLYIICH